MFTLFSLKLIEINSLQISIFNADISFFITSWITWVRQKIVFCFLFYFTSCNLLSLFAIFFCIVLLLLALSVIITKRWIFRFFSNIILFTIFLKSVMIDDLDDRCWLRRSLRSITTSEDLFAVLLLIRNSNSLAGSLKNQQIPPISIQLRVKKPMIQLIVSTRLHEINN